MIRRRLLTIAAAAALAPALPARAVPISQWRGVALGAEASITLAHPEAGRIIDLARAEIARLEAVFSLYRRDSALARLNAAGRLEAPPLELLDCLALAGRVHAATDGAFDPTVQPLWALHAAHYATSPEGPPPAAAAIAAARARTGWQRLRLDPGAIRLEPGMALTLNGIAQGYIADRVAALLRGQGLERVLVNTGEFVALGGDPRGGPWQVRLRAGAGLLPDAVPLDGGALASSAVTGTTFDSAGAAGHILDPRTGRPGPAHWRLVSVTAPSAALADALSTACCLMDRVGIDRALSAFPQARLAALVSASGPAPRPGIRAAHGQGGTDG